MKKYRFYIQENYGSEKFYFEDNNQNDLILEAENEDEAKDALMEYADYEYETIIEEYTPEEFGRDEELENLQIELDILEAKTGFENGIIRVEREDDMLSIIIHDKIWSNYLTYEETLDTIGKIFKGIELANER